MKIKNERGAVMLESTYCILLAILVLIFLISFGFFLYQKTTVTIVANEIAEEVAHTYKLRNVKDSSLVSKADVSGVGKYRYLFFAGSYDSKNETKAKNLGTVRLTKSAVAKDEGKLSVEIETVVDDIGRRHYEVTVKQKYAFLLGNFLSVIGQKDVQTIEKTVYVESVDVLSYVNTVKVTKYGLKKLKETTAIFGFIDSTISLLNSIFTDIED